MKRHDIKDKKGLMFSEYDISIIQDQIAAAKATDEEIPLLARFTLYENTLEYFDIYLDKEEYDGFEEPLSATGPEASDREIKEIP